MFGFVDRLMEFVIGLAVPGIEPIIPGHLKILFRDMLDKEFDKIKSRKSLFYKSIVFMAVVMEGNKIAIIGINPGKSNDRPSEITADIVDNGFWVTEAGFGINIKAIVIFMVKERFGLFKRGSKAFFKFVK